MLVSIPPKISVSSFMGYLKGKSSFMIFDKYANMKYRYVSEEVIGTVFTVGVVGITPIYGDITKRLLESLLFKLNAS